MHEQWNWAVGKPGAEPVLLYERSALEAYYGHFHHAIALAKKADSLRSTGGGEDLPPREDALICHISRGPQITEQDFYKANKSNTNKVVPLCLPLEPVIREAH